MQRLLYIATRTWVKASNGLFNKENILIIVICFVCVCVCTCTYACRCTGQRTIYISWFSSTMQDSQIKLCLSGLASSTLIHLPALVVTFKEGIYRDQGEGSERSAHCANIHVKSLGMCLESQYWGSRDNWIHGALWLASLADSSSSRFKKRFCPKNVKWRAIKRDTQSQHLAPTDTCAQVCKWTHIHTHVQRTHIQTQRQKGTYYKEDLFASSFCPVNKKLPKCPKIQKLLAITAHKCRTEQSFLFD